MTTYEPTGTGHCKRCGQDVSHHIDKAHRFVPQFVVRGKYARSCWTCDEPKSSPIHDVGRVLYCPEGASDE